MNTIDRLTAENTTLRRIVIVLCLLGLYGIAYAVMRDPVLTLAATWGFGAPAADYWEA